LTKPFISTKLQDNKKLRLKINETKRRQFGRHVTHEPEYQENKTVINVKTL